MGEKKCKYSGKLKQLVVEDILNNKLGYHEAMRKYFPHIPDDKDYHFIKKWVNLYLNEGAKRLMEDGRGKQSKGRPKNKKLFFKTPEEEMEYLRAENDYLKKAIALAEKKRKLQGGKKPG
jgi:hypothetical protein